MLDSSNQQSAHPKQRTTLKTGGIAKSLTLEDIQRTGLLSDLSASVRGLLSRFGLASNDVLPIFADQIHVGRRPYQEDATFATIVPDTNSVLTILADGMGGHAAGDVASRIVIETASGVMQEALKKSFERSEIETAMLIAIEESNNAIMTHMDAHPDTAGMGATSVITLIHDSKLYWASVGDSPLYLWRSGKCYQINQDHSMAPQIDQMAKAGMLSVEEALRHPDRNCLTSALVGTPPTLIDAGNDPVQLVLGDIVVLSSDGLQFLRDEQIANVIQKQRKASAEILAAALMNSVLELEDPDQDNIGLIAIKIEKASAKNRMGGTQSVQNTNAAQTLPSATE